MKLAYFATLLLLALISPLARSATKAVLAGGAVSNPEIYEAFIDLVNECSDDEYIGVITAGVTWSIAESTADDIMSTLTKYGATNVEFLPFHTDNEGSCTSSASSTLGQKVKKLTGIYFNGGETIDILNCFAPDGEAVPVLEIIQERYASGDLVLFGSSAGTLAFSSKPVPGARTSYNTLVNGPTFIATKGFDLFSYGFLDVHVNARSRQGRLTRVLRDYRSYGRLGFGIDEDTAMVLQDEKFQVLGTNGVLVLDVYSASSATGNDDDNGRWAVKSARGTYLTTGDRYNITSRIVTIPSYKKRLTSETENDVYAKMTYDIFTPGMFGTLTTRLFLAELSDSTYGYTEETDPRYRVDFRKTSSSYGYMGEQDGTTHITYLNLMMDMYCYSNC